MHIARLQLRNFRTYKEALFHFSSGLNCIVGKNGQGKTNLLEAIGLISTGRSFRTHNLNELISFGETFFFLQAEFYKQGISNKVSIYYDGKTKKIQYNDTNYSAFHALLGVLPSVILSPDDLSLITGAPQERRRFLDLFISQTDSLYLYHLSRYFKAMKQKNHLLKLMSCDTLSSWEEVMAESACYLVAKRKECIAHMTPFLTKWNRILSCDQEALAIHYQMKPKEFADAITLRNYWETMRSQEMALGHTLAGPHRDDLTFHLSERSAKAFSSQGQKRSCLSALRFAEWDCMANTLDDKPLLGLDDFGIQLDSDRQQEMQNHLSSFGQVFLTTPDIILDLPHELIKIDYAAADKTPLQQSPLPAM